MSACSICLDTELREPAACVPCGHTFCYDCITEWLQTPGPRLYGRMGARCPQCRVTVAGVKKLFVSDHLGSVVPISQLLPQPPPMSLWQQVKRFALLVISQILLVYELFEQIAVSNYREVAGMTRNVFQSIGRRYQRSFAFLHLLWGGLSEWARYALVMCLLMTIALVMEDVQQEDGLHVYMVVPMVRLVVGMVFRILHTVGFIAVCVISYLSHCLHDIVMGTLEVMQAVGEATALSIFDLLCVPVILSNACLQLVYFLTVGLLRFMQRVVSLCLFCTTLSIFVSIFHDGWKNFVRDVTLAFVQDVSRRLPQQAGNDMTQGTEDALAPGRWRLNLSQRLTSVARVVLTYVEGVLRQGGQLDPPERFHDAIEVGDEGDIAELMSSSSSSITSS